MGEIKEAIGWLSALDTGSEYGETNKEIILNELERLKTENLNISRELISRTDELNKLLEENEKLKENSDILETNYEILRGDIQKVVNELGFPEDTIISEEFIPMIKEDYIPKQVIRDKIEELENSEHEKLSEKYYFDYQCNLYDFIAGVKKGLKELLGDD